jgi:hypothetical protein
MANRNFSQEEIIRMLREEARLRSQINSGLDTYLEKFKAFKDLQKEILRLEKAIRDAEAEASRLQNATTQEELQQKAIAEERVSILETELKLLRVRNEANERAFKSANVGSMALAKGGASIVRAFGKLPDVIGDVANGIRSLGLIEMDKAIKQSALSMGLMTTQTKNLRFDIKSAAEDTLTIGVGIEELAQYQAAYSEEIGRSVMLSREGLNAISEMAKATGLAAEGATSLAASLEKQGYSAERTRDFIQDTVNSSYKMGLNASKVVKTIQQNIKMVNQYKFKGGVEGLKKMAMTVTKLGIDMGSISGMADKLFDLEGAVDMSAQLQVMGGAWAKMSDPFHLMYMARNDMAGLVEEIGKAAEMSAKFNSKTQEFELSALEMHRLRKIAEQTGVQYETLAEAAINARKQTEIRTQVRYDVSPETKEFLENTAKFDEKGQAYIDMDVNGEKVRKMVRDLSAADQKYLTAMLSEQKSLKKMAEDARTFDDALNNTIMLLKTKLLGGLEVLNEKIIPSIDNFVKRLKDEGWLQSLENAAKYIGGMIGTIGKFILDKPEWALAIYAATKGLEFIFDKLTWISNGMLLAQGFRMGTAGQTLGGMAGGAFGVNPASMAGMGAGARFSAGGRAALGSAGAIGAGVIGGLIGGVSEYSEQKDKGKSTGEALGRGFLKGIGSGGGAYGGAALGAAIGTMALPGIGTAIGGLIGAAAGGLAGGYLTDLDTYGVNDGIFNSPIHDGKLGGMGSDFSKGRGILQGGKITPIDNKDDLIAMKPNGVIDRAFSSGAPSEQRVKHEFGELKLSGQVMVTTPGGGNIGVDLMQNPMFIRELTQKINVEIERMRNQIQKG